MEENKSLHLSIRGMTCSSCPGRIEQCLRKLPGVTSCQVGYDCNEAIITFHQEQITATEITEAITKLGYEVTPKQVERREKSSWLGPMIVLAGFLLVGKHATLSAIFQAFPQPSQSTSLLMLLAIGFLTSFHCLAMCGGICLSQSLGKEGKETTSFNLLGPSLLYNTGRVISYTLIGAIVGLAGTVLQLSAETQGLIQLLAGLFMVLLGINMLGLIPKLRKVRLALPAAMGEKINGAVAGKGPLVVGLLNGLMPCGPLQAMQLYALSTGSPVTGAISMLLFSLGTVPVMLAFGIFSSSLQKATARRLTSAGAALVLVMGLSMCSRGLALTGTTAPAAAYTQNTRQNQQNQRVAVMAEDVQVVTSQLASGRYEAIKVQAGVPVTWIIQAESSALNGCNRSLVVPAYDLRVTLEAGETIVEFLPEESGTFAYSCWMGMIRSSITVVDALE